MEFSEEDRRMLGALRNALDQVVTPPEPEVVVHHVRDDATDALPDHVQSLVDAVAAGELDPYIELLLTLLHSRKRRLRGTRGF